jgi:hypothetical protein
MIGSLRNRAGVTRVSALIREEHGIEAFDDWLAPGPEADDNWKEYEQAKGKTYKEALDGWAATQVFDFDYHHLGRCDGAVLVLPAGKSCHLEAGFTARTKPLFVLLDDPERWDVMYKFAKYICFSDHELLDAIGKEIDWRQHLLDTAEAMDAVPSEQEIGNAYMRRDKDGKFITPMNGKSPTLFDMAIESVSKEGDNGGC